MGKKKEIKKIVGAEPIGGMKELNFAGMTREEQAKALGLPEDATSSQIRKKFYEEAGLKGIRRSKKQELTEAERIQKKLDSKRKASERRQKRLDEAARAGLPVPKKRVKLSPEQYEKRKEEKKKARNLKAQKNRASTKDMRDWGRQERAKYIEMGIPKSEWPKWMLSLK